MAGVKYKRHWFTVRYRGDDKILMLVSGFSEDHIRRKIDFETYQVVIHQAKRWHISKVFSGLPVFYEYASHFGTQDVESLVDNDFWMLDDGHKTLVRVLS